MDQRQEQKHKAILSKSTFSLSGVLTEQSQVYIDSLSRNKWMSDTVKNLTLELDWPEFEP